MNFRKIIKVILTMLAFLKNFTKINELF